MSLVSAHGVLGACLLCLLTGSKGHVSCVCSQFYRWIHKHGDPRYQPRPHRTGFLDFYEKHLPELQTQFPDRRRLPSYNYRTKVPWAIVYGSNLLGLVPRLPPFLVSRGSLQQGGGVVKAICRPCSVFFFQAQLELIDKWYGTSPMVRERWDDPVAI